MYNLPFERPCTGYSSEITLFVRRSIIFLLTTQDQHGPSFEVGPVHLARLSTRFQIQVSFQSSSSIEGDDACNFSGKGPVGVPLVFSVTRLPFLDRVGFFVTGIGDVIGIGATFAVSFVAGKAECSSRTKFTFLALDGKVVAGLESHNFFQAQTCMPGCCSR